MARKIPEIMTEEELNTILYNTKAIHHKVAFALGFYQCLRVSEVVNLRPEHIAIERKLILIKNAKGNKDRNIAIAPEMIKGLKGKLPIKCGIRALQIAFKRVAKRTLGKDLHFHCLRHSGATHYLSKKKWNLRMVQNFLGHTNLETTAIYTHVNPTDMIEAMWGNSL